MSFKKSNNSFSDMAVAERLKGVDSFLKQIDKIIDIDKLRPILNKNGIGTKNVCGVKAYDNVMIKLVNGTKYELVYYAAVSTCVFVLIGNRSHCQYSFKLLFGQRF